MNKKLTIVALVVVALGAGALVLSGMGGTSLGGGYPLAEGDKVASWNWTGSYADNGPLEKQTRDEIARLKGLIGEGQYKDYDLYIGIAGQYELLGEGKSAYDYLSRAIKTDKNKGLAYMNMGHLMETLGALKTARQSYSSAVAAEPSVGIYKAALDQFTATHK